MLYKFLAAERGSILALCAEKILLADRPKSSSDEMERGLPIFYDELIEVLRRDEAGSPESNGEMEAPDHQKSAMRRGRESHRLGYTVSQVVHGYGALCQSITEYSAGHSDLPISAREFNRLNFCLDVAIAEAVTEFSQGQRETTVKEEVQRLGFLAHELRNALASAAAAHRMIQGGFVGAGGSTSKLLEKSFKQMADLIDRSLSEVRLRGEPTVVRHKCRLIDLVAEVEATGAFQASEKSIQLIIEVPADLFLDVDRHLVVSAISNLIQNAIKFTCSGGRVWVRSRVSDERVFIDIEDECGGIPDGKTEQLFRPFLQAGADRSGVGLGLSIARRAIELNGGRVTVRDLPGKGCIFTIDLPTTSPETPAA